MKNDISIAFKKRLEEFLQVKKIRVSKLERDIGMSNGSFAKTTNMSSDKLCKILLYYEDLSAEWLFRGEGEMLIPKSERLAVVSSNNSVAESEIVKMLLEQNKKLIDMNQELLSKTN